MSQCYIALGYQWDKLFGSQVHSHHSFDLSSSQIQKSQWIVTLDVAWIA